MSLGSELRDGRHRLGFTQRQVAALNDVGHEYISRIEHDREQPGARLLQSLAKLYKLSYKRLARLDHRCPTCGRRLRKSEIA